MSDQTTTSPADASGDSAEEPDYKAKYNGLQAAFQKRQNEIAAKETAFAEEKQAMDERLAKLTEYEARDAAVAEEAKALEEYERLSERFATDPPQPSNPNEANYNAQTGWEDKYPRKDADATPKASGWPI